VEAKPLLLESTGAQSFVSGISTFPVGAALKSHAHNTEEMVVLLEGEATVEVGDRDSTHSFRMTPPMSRLAFSIGSSIGARRRCEFSGSTAPRTPRGRLPTPAKRSSTCQRKTGGVSGSNIAGADWTRIGRECGGPLRIITFLDHAAGTEKILSHNRPPHLLSLPNPI